MCNTLQQLEGFWEDTPPKHITIFNMFFDLVNSDCDLKAHRDFVEQHNFGYGDRPFSWMWKLIVESLPQDFTFMEIGVFQGQVMSLVSLMSKRYNKNGALIGITPLTNVDDAFSKHPDLNYEERIAQLYMSQGLDMVDTSFIQGLSTDDDVLRIVGALPLQDCIYIDGGHDYATVVSDIDNFAPKVKVGGLLVMDDSANFLKIPDGLIRMNWRGLLDVSNAVKDRLENDTRFTHLFNVGHNRVWRRIS